MMLLHAAQWSVTELLRFRTLNPKPFTDCVSCVGLGSAISFQTVVQLCFAINTVIKTGMMRNACLKVAAACPHVLDGVPQTLKL